MASLFDLLNALPCPLSELCRVPDDLDAVSTIGHEDPPLAREEALGIERIWGEARRLYRTGTQPGIQLCIQREGRVVLNRSIGYASGNGPRDPAHGPKRLLGIDTPVNLFSASKAVTAMVIHKLDEQNVLRLDDPVCEYIPEFGRHGKDRMTLRHILCHRAGVPNLPPEAFDLELLAEPRHILELLSDERPRTRPGRLLAYHAVTGGFILAEVVKRATGRDIRRVLESEIVAPLGLRWMSYGVSPENVSAVALNAFTGPPPPLPIRFFLRRALGIPIERAVELSNDPRFLTGIIPSANVITTARETATFYQCLLDGGAHGNQQVFQPRTVRLATAEQTFWELDLTLGFPVRYGLGFMLGSPRIGPFGTDNPFAFGHVGLSNVFTWADPERRLCVALLTTGKAIASLHVVPLVNLIAEVGRTFPPLEAIDHEGLRRETLRPPSEVLH